MGLGASNVGRDIKEVHGVWVERTETYGHGTPLGVSVGLSQGVNIARYGYKQLEESNPSKYLITGCGSQIEWQWMCSGEDAKILGL